MALLAAPLVADQLEEREVTVAVGGRRQTSVGCSSIRENSRSLGPDHLSAMLFKAKWLPTLLPSKNFQPLKQRIRGDPVKLACGRHSKARSPCDTLS